MNQSRTAARNRRRGEEGPARCSRRRALVPNRQGRRQSAHRRADVPGDLVTASASGLDPDITFENAEFQLDRVAAKWADDKKLKVDDVRKDIEGILEEKAYAPWGGAIGEKLVNVLDVNLELHKRYGDPA